MGLRLDEKSSGKQTVPLSEANSVFMIRLIEENARSILNDVSMQVVKGSEFSN